MAVPWNAPSRSTKISAKMMSSQDGEKTMARKARPRQRSAPLASGTRTENAKSARDRIIDAFMDLVVEKPIEQIGFNEIAARANLSLSELRALFGSKLAILAAHVKEIDRKVLATQAPDMAEESARERLFDVLMRRLEILEPRKDAVRSLLRSCRRDPAMAMALNGLAVRSQQWMLAAADLDASGPGGVIRAQGLALLFASVLRTWVNDHDPGHARTMAALDRGLARGQRLSRFVDDLCRIPRAAAGMRRRRDSDSDDEQTVEV
jgi:AcrR family transcriptional regulator